MTADLHLGSLMTSAAGGLWQQDKVRSVQNLMIETRAVPPGTPPKDAVKVSRNVSYADYVKAVDAARTANDPKVQALRIARPEHPPEFCVDARGYLVALVRDFQVNAPPAPAVLGVPAKVLRIKAPLVEVALSYEVNTSTPGSLRLKGHIQEFNTGTRGEVIALNDDENQPKSREPPPVGARPARPGPPGPPPEHRHEPGPAQAAWLRDPIGLAAGPLGMGGSTWYGRVAARCSRPSPGRRSNPARTHGSGTPGSPSPNAPAMPTPNPRSTAGTTPAAGVPVAVGSR